MAGYEIRIKDKDLIKALTSSLNSSGCFNAFIEEGRLFCLPEACTGQKKAEKTLSAALTRLIFENREEKKLNGQIKEYFSRFSPLKKAALLKMARELINKDSFAWGLYGGGGRFARLEAEIGAYLGQNSLLDLEGFIRFRLLGYEEYLFTVLSAAGDEILKEEEEEDYIALLRGYLKSHAVTAGYFHLFLFKNGSYTLFKGKNDLEILNIIEGGREEGYEDSLITGLINICPQKLIVHLEEGREPGISAAALKDIFEGRLLFCRGCKICRRGSGIV